MRIVLCLDHPIERLSYQSLLNKAGGTDPPKRLLVRVWSGGLAGLVLYTGLMLCSLRLVLTAFHLPLTHKIILKAKKTLLGI